MGVFENFEVSQCEHCGISSRYIFYYFGLTSCCTSLCRMANVCCKVGTPCATSQCCPVDAKLEKHTLVCSIELLGRGEHLWNLRLCQNIKASWSRHVKTIQDNFSTKFA